MSTLLFDYWRSSSAYRVRIALNFLEIRYDREVIDLLENAQSAPAYRDLNPQGLVPALRIDGLLLTQSLSIIEYLNETRNAGLLPADPVGKARVRALSYAIAMEIHPVCNLSVAKYAVEHSDGSLTMDLWMAHFIKRGLEAVERMLDSEPTGRCCHGDEISIADICLIPQIYNAQRRGVDTCQYPIISRISDFLNTVPAFIAAHPDRVQADRSC